MGAPRGAIPNELERHYVRRAVVHSIVPLAVLEAVRNLDTPVEDGLSEFAEELLSKRLGLSATVRSEEHTSELQSPYDLVCRLLLEKKNTPNSYFSSSAPR